MKVSILVPTYRQGRFLREAVESALAQDHADLEVIVSDDASPDGSLDVLEPLRGDPRLRIHRNDSNLGRVANYRRALYELATGDWAINLDGDDRLLPGYVSRAAALAERHEDVVLVFGNQLERSEATGQTREYRNPPQPEVQAGNDLFLALADGGVRLFHMSCLYDRRRAMALDFYRADIESTDEESFHRLVLGHRVAFLDAFAGVWRRHTEAATVSARLRGTPENLLVGLAPYRRALALGEIPKAELDRWLRLVLHRRAVRDLKTLADRRDLPGALRYLAALARSSPRALGRVLLERKLLAHALFRGPARARR